MTTVTTRSPSGRAAGTAALLLVLAASPSPASREDLHVSAMNESGSMLVFPLIDNVGSAKTVMELSNAGVDGDVWLEGFVIARRYVDGVSSGAFIKRDFHVHLTAGEPFYWVMSQPYTRTDADGVRTSIQGFDEHRGFSFLWAIESRQDRMERLWNHLRGDALILDGARASHYGAIPHQGLQVVPDRVLNLDGIEYTKGTSQFMVDGFAGGIVDGGTLAVCSLDMDLVRSIQPSFVLNLDVWNQIEVPQSRHFHVYQFETLDLWDDLELGIADVFTPKWSIATTSSYAIWAVYLQHLGDFGMAANMWQHPDAGVSARVVLPPIPLTTD